MKSLLALSLTIFGLSCSLYSEEQKYLVKTSSGIVEGQKGKGVITWNNIPYAKAPVGDLRWKAPRSFASNTLIEDEGPATHLCSAGPYERARFILVAFECSA